MTPQAFLVLAALVNIPIFYLLFRIFWKDWRQCVDDWFNPDSYKQEEQAYSGEYSDHALFVGACVSAIAIEYLIYVFVLGGNTCEVFERVMDFVMIWLAP